jgi:hypothetical protein
MIYVIDNNESYDEHLVILVDTAHAPDVVEKVVGFAASHTLVGQISGSTTVWNGDKKYAWYKPKSLGDYLQRYGSVLHWHTVNGESLPLLDSNRLDQLPNALVVELAHVWMREVHESRRDDVRAAFMAYLKGRSPGTRVATPA